MKFDTTTSKNNDEKMSEFEKYSRSVKITALFEYVDDNAELCLFEYILHEKTIGSFYAYIINKSLELLDFKSYQRVYESISKYDDLFNLSESFADAFKHFLEQVEEGDKMNSVAKVLVRSFTSRLYFPSSKHGSIRDVFGEYLYSISNIRLNGIMMYAARKLCVLDRDVPLMMVLDTLENLSHYKNLLGEIKGKIPAKRKLYELCALKASTLDASSAHKMITNGNLC